MGSHNKILRIAIVGAGPVGVAFAKYLLAEKAFRTIDIFEQRDRVGGVWNLSPTERTRRIPIPQTDPRYGSHQRSGTRNGSLNPNHIEASQDSLEFESPLYDYLETNIPKQLMQYSDTPFPEDFPLYPSHEEVLDYLEAYADDVRHLIRFQTQVQDVRLQSSTGRGQSTWIVTTKDLKTEKAEKDPYDAIVVANGHYTVPLVPGISGVAEWNKAYPGVIIHSKAYRKPEDFRGQKVLIIGNSASGLDLAAQIGQHSKAIYLSSRSASVFESNKVSWRKDIDEITEFLSPSKDNHKAIRTKSGIVVEGIDSVIFATGYLYSYPFLSSLEPPVITDGLRTRDTYQHFIHINHPELAFPVLNTKVIPFGLAENQAAVIARMWSGRLPIPSLEETQSWEKAEIERKGEGKHFHLQKVPDDGAQMNDLYAWAESARQASDLENNGKGKLGMIWNERMVWMRSCFAAIKAAYTDKGEDRRKLKTIEELGFSFDEWLKNANWKDRDLFRRAKCPS